MSEGKEQVPPVLFIGNKKDLTDKDPDSKQVPTPPRCTASTHRMVYVPTVR